MDWLKALTMGVADYLALFFAFMLADVFTIARGPIAVVLVVANLFLVLFLSYYYYHWTGERGTRNGLILGATWVVIAIIMEFLLVDLFLYQRTAFGNVTFWMYNLERLLIPLLFSTGLLEIMSEDYAY